MKEKILLATKKPFARAAREEVVKIFEKAGYGVKVLEEYQEDSKLLQAVKDANALIVRSDKVTPEVMDAAPELKLVVRAGAGYDNIDCEAAKERGIAVMNTPGQNANAVAELAVGLMIMAARGKYNGKPGTELKNKVLGLQGFGNVGRCLARIAGRGLEMKVTAYDPYLPPEKIKEAGVEPVESLAKLYRESDYISLHIPAGPGTLQSINYDLLQEMKEGAVLVNTARAEIIHEKDLLKIYQERPDINYISDIAPDNKEEMLACDGNRCFFTPKKMGAQTAEANFNAGVAAANQIIGFFENGDTTFQVNK
jgi:D-3-phosphoglycerate dehydrogenase